MQVYFTTFDLLSPYARAWSIVAQLPAMQQTITRTSYFGCGGRIRTDVIFSL